MNKIRMMQTAIVALMIGASVSCTQIASSSETLTKINELMPTMIRIEGGSFMMGDTADEGDGNELPVHQVIVSDFAIAENETTFELYDLFAITTGRTLPSDEGWGRGTHPVTNVSWHDAQALAAWLSQQTGRSFRLPSEAEWEYAARAGTTTAYANGETISREYGNYGYVDCCGKGPGISGRDIWGNTSPVGFFEPNQWGLYDTVGNVWEWTQDCWNATYDGAPTDGSAWMEGDCARSPLKGGSWVHYSRNLRPANRNDNDRIHARNGYGFRLAEDI